MKASILLLALAACAVDPEPQTRTITVRSPTDSQLVTLARSGWNCSPPVCHIINGEQICDTVCTADCSDVPDICMPD